jgi:urease accessory protein
MMRTLHVHSRAEQGVTAHAMLLLPYDARQKSRFRSKLPDGREVVVMLPRGQTLHDGDSLLSDEGVVLGVVAMPEPVSVVRTKDALLISRVAYHLGNRHMPLQILPNELRYPHDHVLDDMVRQLGLTPTFEQLPFEAENGAYGSGHSFASRGHTHHHHGDSHSHESGVFDHSHAGDRSKGVIHVNWPKDELDAADEPKVDEP